MSGSIAIGVNHYSKHVQVNGHLCWVPVPEQCEHHGKRIMARALNIAYCIIFQFKQLAYEKARKNTLKAAYTDYSIAFLSST